MKDPHSDASPAGEHAGQRRHTDSHAPLVYTVRFPEPHTHYAEVEVRVPVDAGTPVDLMMAVWTPGSYLVREYARNVEQVVAHTADGQRLPVEKTHKNRWRIAAPAAAAIVVAYRVYGREMSVRTNWIEAGFALLNGAPTFMTLADGITRHHEVRLHPPSGWTQSFTGLPSASGEPHHYRAPDFDTLVDSPILLGAAAAYRFNVDGIPHVLANQGEDGVFDGQRAAADLERIVVAQRRFWGTLPYERYVFLNLITESGGGLEHRNSTVLMASRWTTRTRRAYLDWLELASHEFFHTWNVKRLRPVELGPFDYEREAFTRTLWVAEGFTDYYGDLLVHRAGLSSREEYFNGLSQRIEEVETTPGRYVRSAEQASHDAWIKHYRPDENSANVTISYYTKGAVIAFLLDATIRAASDGARSLDDAMRLAYTRYADARGYTGEQIRAAIEEIAGIDLSHFWATTVEGTDDIDYAIALRTFGLRLGRRTEVPALRPTLGMTTRNDSGRLLIAQVRRGSPAMAAGLNVDDEVLAIDGFRVRADRFEQRLEQYRPGDRVVVLIARRERLMEVAATIAAEPPRIWRLEPDPEATPAQLQQQGRWLTGE